MNLESLKFFVAAIFDFFKMKSPIIAAGVLSVLTIVAFNFDKIATDFNITNATFLAIAKWASFILLALTGSRTSQILQEAEKVK